jgi:hypothetical protein
LLGVAHRSHLQLKLALAALRGCRGQRGRVWPSAPRTGLADLDPRLRQGSCSRQTARRADGFHRRSPGRCRSQLGPTAAALSRWWSSLALGRATSFARGIVGRLHAHTALQHLL